ncbi:hypothetical protein ACFXG4_52220 [Nocardia sp. NPDC059246]|uniref:hypothetical protein n=1 Tax=unclassified Nocardia TaxID=2637762 RepID=UPI0036ABEA24
MVDATPNFIPFGQRVDQIAAVIARLMATGDTPCMYHDTESTTAESVAGEEVAETAPSVHVTMGARTAPGLSGCRPSRAPPWPRSFHQTS